MPPPPDTHYFPTGCIDSALACQHVVNAAAEAGVRTISRQGALIQRQRAIVENAAAGAVATSRTISRQGALIQRQLCQRCKCRRRAVSRTISRQGAVGQRQRARVVNASAGVGADNHW